VADKRGAGYLSRGKAYCETCHPENRVQKAPPRGIPKRSDERSLMIEERKTLAGPTAIRPSRETTAQGKRGSRGWGEGKSAGLTLFI
jgi:hypothetical protein